MATIRPSILSGTWYPADPQRLTEMVSGFLAGADPAQHPAGRPYLVVVPHAGYTYSGATAGKLYGLLAGDTYDTVVILAPPHRKALGRIALSAAEAFATPLGRVPVACDIVQRLAAEPAFAIDEAAHRDEHAIEIQLPFLQASLAAGFRIVPMLVPQLSAADRATAADQLAELRRQGALLIVSTDFTHYGASYGFLPFDEDVPRRLEQLDTGAILPILGHDPEALIEYGERSGITMCGLQAAALAISGQAPPNYEAALIDYSRSGDRDGDYSLSVSYAALILSEAAAPPKDPRRLSSAERAYLLQLARAAVSAAARDEEPPDPAALAAAQGVELSEELTAQRGAFVTLTSAGKLRGCIGYIEGIKSLIEAVADNGRSAAVSDPRFAPVEAAELAQISIEISALTPLRPVSGPEAIEIGRHGIVLSRGPAKAVFLPQVATEQGWDRDTTLTHLALKAGLGPDGWKSGAEFAIFEAEIMAENQS